MINLSNRNSFWLIVITLTLVPFFYTYIIYPFYYKENLYVDFIKENVLFWSLAVFSFCLISSVLQSKKTLPRVNLINLNIYLVFVLFIPFLYIILNVLLLGWTGFYSGCHYCGVEPIGGFNLLRIIIFDIGTVACMLIPLLFLSAKSNKYTKLYAVLVSALIVVFLVVGSYRNQLLPISVLIVILLGLRFNKLYIFFITFMLLSPIAAITMAFYHYFEDGNASFSLFEYFSQNEFYSNYNNFLIFNDGFVLDLPFPGASYIGPLLHRLSSFIATGFVTPAGQMAQYMGTGIGYGFSPLLEAKLNFGDLYFFGAFFLALFVAIFFKLAMMTNNTCMRAIFISLLVFYIFNLNRVDFTAATNVFLHKFVLLYIASLSLRK